MLSCQNPNWCAVVRRVLRRHGWMHPPAVAWKTQVLRKQSPRLFFSEFLFYKVHIMFHTWLGGPFPLFRWCFSFFPRKDLFPVWIQSSCVKSLPFWKRNKFRAKCLELSNPVTLSAVQEWGMFVFPGTAGPGYAVSALLAVLEFAGG